MGPVNNILNRIHAWNDQETGAFKRQIGSRVTNLLVTAPTELVAVAQNILLTPVHAASTVLKISTKVVSFISGSTAVKKFEEKLPGFTELLRTIARIVAYSIGTALTISLGFVLPNANFKAHCALGLAINKKEEAIKAALAEKEAEEAKKQAEAEAIRQNELEALNNLATAYTVANEIELGTQEEVLESVATLFDETTPIAEEQPAEVTETEADPIEFIAEFEEEIVGASFLSNVINGVATQSKSVISGTINVVAHPVESAKKAYNYASSFFVAQKA